MYCHFGISVFWVPQHIECHCFDYCKWSNKRIFSIKHPSPINAPSKSENLARYNVCSVAWVVLSTMGGYHEYRGGYLEYRGDVQYRGGISWYRGGYHEYREGVQHRGGYNLLLFEYPTVLSIPTVLMISSHGTEHPPRHGTEHTLHRMIWYSTPLSYWPISQRKKLVYNGGLAYLQPILLIKSSMDVDQILQGFSYTA